MTTIQDQLKLPQIALGAWAWGDTKDGYFGNDYTVEDFRPVFQKAISEGLNLWDTAAVYGMGTSEHILGELAKSISRNEWILSTKFTPQIADNTSEAVSNMFAESMERLGSDYADIYWIHNPADVKRWTPQIASLAKEQQIKFIGVSNHNLDEIKLAKEILENEGLKLSAVQNHFSLLNRSSEEAGIIDYCKENDMAFFSYMVLEQGALSGKYDSDHLFPEGSERAKSYNPLMNSLTPLISDLKKIAASRQATVAQIATAWAIGKGTVPIIGVTKVDQVVDAAAATTISLQMEEINKLEELASETQVSTIREWEKDMNK